MGNKVIINVVWRLGIERMYNFIELRETSKILSFVPHLTVSLLRSFAERIEHKPTPLIREIEFR